MSSRFILFEISSSITHMKEKLALFSTSGNISLIMSSHVISFEISCAITYMKEKLALFSTLDTILLIIEILGWF